MIIMKRIVLTPQVSGAGDGGRIDQPVPGSDHRSTGHPGIDLARENFLERKVTTYRFAKPVVYWLAWWKKASRPSCAARAPVAQPIVASANGRTASLKTN